MIFYSHFSVCSNGGHNGLVDVDELIAAQSGVAVEGAKKKPALKFQQYTMIGGTNQWDISDGMKEDSAGIKLKGHWKVSGNITPHIPIFMEVCLHDETPFDNIYSAANPNVGDNLVHLFTDTVFDPISYWNGEETGGFKKATYLGAFKMGVETQYVNWTTGYLNQKLPSHSNVNWVTVDQEWESGYSAGGGFNQFELGQGTKDFFKELSDGLVDVELVLSPNRAADRAGTRYGFYGYADANIGGKQYFDIQYNGAYGTEWNTFAKDVMEDDIIFGYKGNFGDAKDWGAITVKANYLLNLYGSTATSATTKALFTPASSDVGAVKDVPDSWIDNMAGNLNVTFENDLLTAVVGGRMRGAQANMMYVEDAGSDDHTNIKDQLGKTNRLRFWADVKFNLMYEALSLGIKPYYEQYLREDAVAAKYTWNDSSNKEIYVKPYFTLDLMELCDFNATVDGYGELRYHTSANDLIKAGGCEGTAFALDEIGLKYSMKFEDSAISNLSVTYFFDNNYEKQAMHGLMTEAALPFGINAQLGMGLRTENNALAALNPIGFYAGANKEICRSYKTILYGNFVYAMDPYKSFSDGQYMLKLEDYRIDRDADYFQKQAALRIGVNFNF